MTKREAPIPHGLMATGRVLVGESVWEDVTISTRDGWLSIEFDSEDLDSIAIPLSALERSLEARNG